MQNKLLAVADFQVNIADKGDVATLLKEIRGIAHQMEANTSVYDAVDEAKRKYYMYVQGELDSNAKHLQTFKNIVEVVKHHGGSVFQDEGLMAYEKGRTSRSVGPQFQTKNTKHE